MDLPIELYKEIFNYFDEYKLLRLVNKLFLRILDEIEVESGIFVRINSIMVKNFIKTNPDKISLMIIAKISERYYQVIYKKIEDNKYAKYELTSEGNQYNYPDYRLNEQLYDAFGWGPDLFQHDNEHLHFIPLKEILLYYINRHYLVQLKDSELKDHELKVNERFIKRSLLRTTNFYTNMIRKNYPSKTEYIDFYLKLMDL